MEGSLQDLQDGSTDNQQSAIGPEQTSRRTIRKVDSDPCFPLSQLAINKLCMFGERILPIARVMDHRRTPKRLNSTIGGPRSRMKGCCSDLLGGSMTHELLQRCRIPRLRPR